MMQVPGLGAFVRARLPVQLTGGHTVTYGVWVGIHPDDLQRAFAIWWQPEYTELTLDGALANALHPRVLTETWPHPETLDALT